MPPPHNEARINSPTFEALGHFFQQTRRQKLAPFGSAETGSTESRLKGNQSVDSVQEFLEEVRGLGELPGVEMFPDLLTSVVE